MDPAALAEKMFNAYNAQGPNPGKTWDGKDVPPWSALNDQVRAKWTAAANEAQGPIALDVLPVDVPAPTIGRFVRFAEAGGPYASIVAAVNADGSLELATFGRNSLYFQHGIKFNAEGAKGTWCWPPKA